MVTDKMIDNKSCINSSTSSNPVERGSKKMAPLKIVFYSMFFSLVFLHFSNTYAQSAAEKTNLLGWATLSPNIGTEFAVMNKTNKWSLDAQLSYHPWKPFSGRSLRHWLASPELRWWYCRRFEGSFWGVHLLGGEFNVHDLPLLGMSKEYEYSGYLIGGGISYGYQIPLSPRWGMEFTAGIGYVWISYDKYECKECREKVAEGNYNYYGLTRLGVSLIYFLQ
jgi:hypothetical protein